MAGTDIYSLLAGGSSPNSQIPDAVVAALRNKQTVGAVGALSGDPVLGPFGQNLMRSSDQEAETLGSQAQRQQQMAQQGAFQTGELAHMTAEEAQSKSALAETVRQHNLENQQKMMEMGYTPDGSAPNPHVETMAQAIARYQMAPPTGFSMRNPLMQAAFARAMEINPDYDANQFGMRKKAEADFGTGKAGNAVRAANTAIAHLGTLGTAVDALGNNDLTAFNTAKNYYEQQTGQPAPGNFNAVRDFVGNELSSYLTGGGGGVTDREKMQGLISTSNSPAQLAGVISNLKQLMSGQLRSYKLQYETSTGRNDFTTKLSPETMRELGMSSGTAGRSAAPQRVRVDAQGNVLGN